MAATTTYTSKPLVKGYLPRSYSATDLPDSSDTTYESIDTKILKVSRSIDSILGAVYCSFNSTSGTPATPHVIQDIATMWTVGLCLLQIAPGDRNGALAQRADAMIAEAKERCRALTDTNNGDSIPPEIITENLTFGAGGTFDLSEHEAFIMVHSNLTSTEMPTLLVESVRPTLSGYTNYHYGRDFSVAFRPEHQKWVFTDHLGSFSGDAGTKSITYRFDWKRQTWKPGQATVTSSGLIGGF